MIGELRVTAPSEPVRSAVLEVRRIRDYVPRASAPWCSRRPERWRYSWRSPPSPDPPTT
ncbi:hypothetical protein [Blastococcus brunescens]|uniref:Uncharacterized protein n=1 Tax=Blastococcus brunescens TaxID=1564165 RepID=A0ABZ1AVE5_9ACTN|nr:hypothetical protein [Blastococcus sp. BMG 8361]WRL62535.1 hypothetical protein U6N30_21445 [Blastococcus sp. BMG 8361]